MTALDLTRNRGLRRILALLSLLYLVGAVLEPAAHGHLEAAPPPAQQAGADASHGAGAAPSAAAPDPSHPGGALPGPERSFPTELPHDFDCVLCHAAGSGSLPAGATPVGIWDAGPLVTSSGAEAVHAAEAASGVRARAPPVSLL